MKPPAGLGFRNVTVDSQNPAIAYSPQAGWSNATIGDVDPGRVCMVTSTPNGTASFSFTGIAIYYLAPLWPYERSSGLMLDAGPIVRFNLTDHSHVAETTGGPATVKSGVVASVVGLGNTLHTVRVSVAEGQSSSVFDRFMYTILEPEDLPPIVTSSNPPHFSTPVFLANSTAPTTPASNTPAASPSRTPSPSSASLSETRRISGALNSALIVTCVVVFLFICGVAWLLLFSENGIHTCYRQRRGSLSPNELESASGSSTPTIIEDDKSNHLPATRHGSVLYPPQTMLRNIPWISPPMRPPSVMSQELGDEMGRRRWSMSVQSPSSSAVQEFESEAQLEGVRGSIGTTQRR